MKVKEFSLLVGFFVLIISVGYAQERWIPFDTGGVPQKVELEVVSCDAQGIVINVRVYGMFSQRLDTKYLLKIK